MSDAVTIPTRFSRAGLSSYHPKGLDGNHGRSVGSSSHEHHWFSSRVILISCPREALK